MKVKYFIPILLHSNNPLFKKWVENLRRSKNDIQAVINRDAINIITKDYIINGIKNETFPGWSTVFICCETPCILKYTDITEYMDLTGDEEDELGEYCNDWVLIFEDTAVVGTKQVLKKLKKLPLSIAYEWNVFMPERKKKLYRPYNAEWDIENQAYDRHRKVTVNKYYKAVQNFLDTVKLSAIMNFQTSTEFENQFNDELNFLKAKKLIFDDSHIFDMKFYEFGYEENMFYFEASSSFLFNSKIDKYNNIHSSSYRGLRKLDKEICKAVVLVDLHLQIFNAIQRAFFDYREYLHISNEVQNAKISHIRYTDTHLILEYDNHRSLQIKL